MRHLRETLEQGEYRCAVERANGDFHLYDEDSKVEVWFENPGHASYGIVLDDGTELEFARNLRGETT